MSMLKPYTQLSYVDLIEKVKRKQIQVVIDSPSYRISCYEFDRIKTLANKLINMDDAIAPILENYSIFSFSDADSRNHMTEYLIANDYFGIPILSANELPLFGGKMGLLLSRDDAPMLCDKMRLYILGYGKAPGEKTELLLERYAETFPITVKALHEYLGTLKKDYSDDTILTMVDGVLSLAPMDLSQCTESEIEKTIIGGFLDKTRASCALLADFLFRSGFSRRMYAFSKSSYKADVTAYPEKRAKRN